MSGRDEANPRRRRLAPRPALLVALPFLVCIAATAAFVATLEDGYTSTVTVGLGPQVVLDELDAVRGVDAAGEAGIARADLLMAERLVPRRPWMRGRVLDHISIARSSVGRDLSITARGPDRAASERLALDFTAALAGERARDLDRVVRELRAAVSLERRLRVGGAGSRRAFERARVIAPLEGGGLLLPDPLRVSETRPVKRPARDLAAAAILGLLLSLSALAYRARARSRARP